MSCGIPAEDAAGGWTPRLVVILATALMYANTLDNPFLEWDDNQLVTENPDVKTTPLWELFTRPSGKTYLPFRSISYALDYRIWGLNPVGFHLTNLLLHIGSGLLVLAIVKRLAGERAGLVAALLFAAHPCAVEAVTWISGRRDTLSALFSLLCIWFYMRQRYRTSFAAAVVAVFSKGLAIVLAPVLLVYELFADADCRTPMRPREGWLRRLYPFVLLCVAAAAVHYVVGRSVGAVRGETGSRLPSLPLIVWSYFRLFFFPVHLRTTYDTPPVLADEIDRMLLPLAGLAAIIFALVRLGTRLKWFWLGWFLASLVPVLQLVPISTLVAERYIYFAAIGLCGWTAELLAKHKCWPVLVAVFGLTTFWRNTVWDSPDRLWRDALLKSPDGPTTQQDYGNELLRRGNPQAAIKRYQTAAHFLPDSREPYLGMGDAYRALGRESDARAMYNRARRVAPLDPYPLVRLAKLDIDAGETESAERYLRKAEELDPWNPSVLLYLGVVAEKRSAADAVAYYERCLAIDPERQSAHYNLGNILLKLGRLRDAEEHLRAAVRLAPAQADAKANLAALYVQQRRFVEAEKLLRDALRLEPDLWPARATLGHLYLLEGDRAAALRELRRALEDSGGAEAVKTLIRKVEESPTGN